MKKTILLSTLFAAAAAVAETTVESGNAVAALSTTVSDSAKQTLLAVPFEGYETSGQVKVADIVKTSGLADDSKLYVPNTIGEYDTWTLQSGQWTADVKVSVGLDGTVTKSTTASADNLTIKRGDAFWLEPQFESGKSSGTVILLGQGDGNSGTSSVAPGWNLVGNASTSAVSLAALTSSDGDQIIVQNEGMLRYYTYKPGKGWRYQIGMAWSNPEDNPLTIAPGRGFWYKSKSDADKTINWGTQN